MGAADDKFTYKRSTKSVDHNQTLASILTLFFFWTKNKNQTEEVILRT